MACTERAGASAAERVPPAHHNPAPAAAVTAATAALLAKILSMFPVRICLPGGSDLIACGLLWVTITQLNATAVICKGHIWSVMVDISFYAARNLVNQSFCIYHTMGMK
jgi:hypothetical protein